MATSPSPTVVIPARHGVAKHLPRGTSIKIINTHGTQVVDTWAFTLSFSLRFDALTGAAVSPPSTPSSTESPSYDPPYVLQHLSMPHTRAALNRLTPRVGDTMVSNERRAMLTLVEDTTDGVHDTLIAACDRWRYLDLLGEEKGQGHRNCEDNLGEALEELGITPPAFTPSPLNLFMNIPVHEDRRTISFEAPTSKPGQYVVLKAEMDLVIVFSACPQDILTINCGKPVDAHYQITESN